MGTNFTDWVTTDPLSAQKLNDRLGELDAAIQNGGQPGHRVWQSDAAAQVPATIKGATSQSANLTEWRDSTGAVLASIDAAGAPSFPTGSIGATELATVPVVRVFHNANQSIADAATTALAFNSERYDTDTMHDTVTNNSRITIKTAGKYAIGVVLEWAANATGERLVLLKANGASYIGAISQQAVSVASIPTRQNLVVDWDFSVNDYIEVEVRQVSGGALNVVSGSAYSPEFWAHRIGR